VAPSNVSRVSRYHRNPDHSGMAASSQQDLAGPVRRDRKVVSIAVACPVCGVMAGEHCRTAAGKETQGHRARRWLALRAERGEV
jgi:hypothetical protein